jgi:hypothetical protein
MPEVGKVPGGTNMARIRRLTVAALLLAAGLVPAGQARAGFLGDLFGCGDCPAPSYSPLRYWAPGPARVNDCVHGPRYAVSAPDSHPEIPPTSYIIKFPCPAAAPISTLIPTPTPPATSRFRY